MAVHLGPDCWLIDWSHEEAKGTEDMAEEDRDQALMGTHLTK